MGLAQRYRILEEIGRGGFSVVSRAEDQETGQTVCVKQLLLTSLPPEAGRVVLNRFLQQYPLIKALEHPNIVRLLDYYPGQAEHFLVMEDIHGRTLKEHLGSVGQLPPAEAVAIATGLAVGLSYAHLHGVMHLDIKPANVLLVDVGGKWQPKFGDFMLSCAGTAAAPEIAAFSVESSHYLAPELRKENDQITPAADVYSFGKLFYVMLSGKRPDRIDPAAIPAEKGLAEIVFRCIKTNPADRDNSMDAVITALTRLGTDTPTASSARPKAPSGVGAATLAVAGGQEVGPLPSERAQERVRTDLEDRLEHIKQMLHVRKLNTCRGAVGEVNRILDMGVVPRDSEWFKDWDRRFTSLAAELERREQRLKEYGEAAKLAYEERRWEECQTIVLSAHQMSLEKTPCDTYAKLIEEKLSEIATLWERAIKYFDVGKMDSARATCDMVLALNREHPEALAMLARIAALERHAHLRRVAKITVPIVIVAVLLVVAVVFYFHHTAAMIADFERAAKPGSDVQKALRAAARIQKRHPPAAEFISRYEQLQQSLREVDELAATGQPEKRDFSAEVAQQWQDCRAWCEKAAAAGEQSNFAEAERGCDRAKAEYQQVIARTWRERGTKAEQENRLVEAKQFYETLLSVTPDSAFAKARLKALERELIPELRLSSFISGREYEGAAIYLNDNLLKERTPATIPLEVGTEYRVRITMSARKGTYVMPFETVVRLAQPQALTLKAELKIVPGPTTGANWTIPQLELELIAIEPGTFMMGGEREDKEKPRRQVRLTRPFWMGKYEVTQKQYTLIRGQNPSSYAGVQLPVDSVTWFDADAFGQALTKWQEYCLPEGYVYRLPTEAEWEYCCRAGTTGDYAGEVEALAWHKDDLQGVTYHTVGLKSPNAWGLYDLHGNVWEWCHDWYDSYARAGTEDPTGPRDGDKKVMRGGSRAHSAATCRSASRAMGAPAETKDFIGFRVVLGPRLK